MRADRLLAIVLVLQNKKRATAAELAELLEVSVRTIYRDMDALTTAGIPVLSERGSQGGWRLLEGYRANLNALNMNELQTLFLNQPLFADLGLARTAQNALLKVLTTLSAYDQVQADSINRRLYIDPEGWQRAHEHVPSLSTLQSAVWSDRKVKLTYRRADQTIIDRFVAPMGLVAKGGVWYLVAEAQGEMRIYRVSRVLAATIADEHFTRPPDFDLSAFWHRAAAEHMDNLARYPVTLRVSPQSLGHIRSGEAFFRIDVLLVPESEDWYQIRIYFGTIDEAREFVLSFGSSIEVLEPSTLREEVLRNAVDVINLYQSNRQCLLSGG